MESISQKPILVACSILLLLFFSVNFIFSNSRNVFALVPVNTLITNSFVWNLVTSSFFETNIIKLIFDLFGLFFISNDLEMGPIENFGLLIVFNILACSIGTSSVCFIRFFITADEVMLVEPTYGFMGVFFCLLSYQRREKKNSIIHSKVPQITYQNLTFWVYFVQILFYITGIKALTKDLSFSTFSILFSWTYLRFAYRNPDGSLGDTSDDFMFVNMFPVVLQPIVIPLSTAFYNLIALTGLFPQIEIEKKGSQHHLRQNDSSRGLLDSQLIASRVSDVVSERRRAKAQKVKNILIFSFFFLMYILF